MAFFEEGSSTTALAVESVPTYISNYHEAALSAVAESESNYNSLMQAIGLHENKMIRESGECVYNEGAMGNFWEKVKKFFVSIIAKIKGIFHSFMSRFDAQFKGGKSFFDKYKKEIAEKLSKVDKDKLKFTGYKFTHHDVSNSKLVTDTLPKVNITDAEAEALVAGRDKADEAMETARGVLIGGGSFTASEFSKELFQYFRNGESAKSEVDGIDLAYFAKVLGSDKLSKTITDSYKALEKSIEAAIKACDAASKTSIDTQTGSGTEGEKSSASKKTAAYPIIVSQLKGMIAIKQTYVGAQMQAISNEVSQAKGFAAQVIRASVKESGSWTTNYDENASDDFLGAVNFK